MNLTVSDVLDILTNISSEVHSTKNMKTNIISIDTSDIFNIKFKINSNNN